MIRGSRMRYYYYYYYYYEYGDGAGVYGSKNGRMVAYNEERDTVIQNKYSYYTTVCIVRSINEEGVDVDVRNT
jgi:hypothetical protein